MEIDEEVDIMEQFRHREVAAVGIMVVEMVHKMKLVLEDQDTLVE